LAARIDPPADPFERFEAIRTQVIESFTAHRRLWAATFDVLGQIEHIPRIREQLAASLQEAHEGLGRVFHDVSGPQAARVGAFYQALLTGVMAQLLIDPAHGPTGRELAETLRFIAS
jgi:hypothetical protein